MVRRKYAERERAEGPPQTTSPETAGTSGRVSPANANPVEVRAWGWSTRVVGVVL